MLSPLQTNLHILNTAYQHKIQHHAQQLDLDHSIEVCSPVNSPVDTFLINCTKWLNNDQTDHAQIQKKDVDNLHQAIKQALADPNQIHELLFENGPMLCMSPEFEFIDSNQNSHTLRLFSVGNNIDVGIINDAKQSEIIYSFTGLTFDDFRDTLAVRIHNLLQEFQNISGVPYELKTLVKQISDLRKPDESNIIILFNKAAGKSCSYLLKEEEKEIQKKIQKEIQIFEIPINTNGTGVENHKLVASIANLTFEDIRSHYKQTAPVN